MNSKTTADEVTPFTPTEVQKQVFTLSWLSGAAQQMSQAELQTQLQTVEANIGAWTVAWGPQNTFDSNGNVDNTMFVAQATNTAQPTFVVAVAGTNPLSQFAWQTEDLGTTPRDWPYASGAGQVTTGDSVGLENLLAMTYNGQTLQGFLAGISNKPNASLTFAGISLGGALAPMLTLALMDPASTLNTTNDVSISNWAQVSLLAIAGPSIGDATFVQYFNTTLATANCTFIWNANDVVPHAWNKATMMALTSPANIYNLTLNPTSCIATQIATQQKNAAGCNYTQFDPTPSFSGSLQSYTTPPNALVSWNPQSEFLAQTLYQHTTAYVMAFNCQDWLQSKAENICAEPGTAATLLALVNARLCNQIPTT